MAALKVIVADAIGAGLEMRGRAFVRKLQSAML